jgi:alpha-glucosidase
MSEPPWWKSCVIYQIYPRSFAEGAPPDRSPAGGRGPAVGDLAGIRSRLDHLVRLGVDAIWLSPFYRSPMRDFGYDVSDHCDVDPVFGTLDDFDDLVADCHAHGIRVVVDLVPNHTSDLHPWFQASRSSRDDPKRDWYVWRDPGPDGRPPNNWVAAFRPEPAWTFDEATGQYYLHLFLPEQPDLNWANPQVEAAMHDVVRFWLDRGVDGFRIDVVHGLGKDPDLADDPEELAGLPHVPINDRPETHPLLRRLRTLVDSYPGERMIVGEVYLLDTHLVAPYYGDDDELHLSFNFPPLYARWDAGSWREQIETTTGLLDPLGAWPTWVLSNHDNPRHRSRYGGSETRARAAALLLLGLRGTPFLYAGEELGLLDAEIPADRVVDPGGRDGSRAPIPWDPTHGHGWPAEPWLPFPPETETHSVADEWADPRSTLSLYQRLLVGRRSSSALHRGDQRLLHCPDGVLGWMRSAGSDRRIVLVNFTDQMIELDGTEALGASAGWIVEVASDHTGEGSPFTGHLGSDQALWLRPA